jgi:hypothetical protein
MSRTLSAALAGPVVACFLFGMPAVGQTPPDPEALAHSIEQLRASVGTWDTTTEFLNDDGSVARSVEGTYQFSWVVPDRVLSGRTEIPELGQASGILFYVNPTRGTIEMVSVGGDGNLWVMTGPLGGEERTTQEYPAADGGTGRLRFTRFNVAPDSFESRMEYTDDGGRSWKPGNHQRFQRRSGAPA